MKVVILGATGFLGSHLTQALLADDGIQLLAVGRSTRVSSIKVPQLSCDLYAAGDLGPVLQGAAACVHLANDVVPATAERAGIGGVARNLELSYRVAEACVSEGVNHLVFASSGGTVYGRNVVAASEDLPCDPIGLYGVQKLAVEALIRAKLRGTSCASTILRIGNPFGAGQESQRAHGVIGHILRALITESPFTVWGDGSQVRDYVYIQDVVLAIKRALIVGGAHDIINIGSGIGTSTRDLIQVCQSIAGHELRVSYNEHPVYDVDRISLNILKAKGALGWSPSVGLVDGIRTYYTALSEHL